MTVLVLPHSRASATAARHRLRDELASAGLARPVIDDAMLVVDELVGNAVLHGRPLPDGAIRVRWTSGEGTVRIAITDGGSGATPAPCASGPLAVSGRGLRIVAELAIRWGVTRGSGTSTVWAVVGAEPSR